MTALLLFSNSDVSNKNSVLCTRPLPALEDPDGLKDSIEEMLPVYSVL